MLFLLLFVSPLSYSLFHASQGHCGAFFSAPPCMFVLEADQAHRSLFIPHLRMHVLEQRFLSTIYLVCLSLLPYPASLPLPFPVISNFHARARLQRPDRPASQSLLRCASSCFCIVQWRIVGALIGCMYVHLLGPLPNVLQDW